MADEDRLKQAIALVRAGDVKTGGTILHDLLRNDRNIELAWLWLTACVDSVEDKRYCLNEVLRINPDNEHARKGLDHLSPPPEPTYDSRVDEQPGDNEVLARLETATNTPQATPQQAAQPAQPIITPPARPAIQPTRAAASAPAVRTARSNGSNSGLLLAALVILLLIAVAGMALILMNPGWIEGLTSQPTDLTQGYQVEYIVTGSAERVQVSYNNAANQAQILEVRQLPFSRKVDVPPGSKPNIVMTVQNLTSFGTINCEIKINGVSKTTNHSSAANGFSSCSTLP